MPEFNVKLLRAGALHTQRVQAADAAGVAAALGIPPELVLAADPVKPAGPAGDAASFPLRLFSQDLATLLDAGIPMLESLRAMRSGKLAAPPAGPAGLTGSAASTNSGGTPSAAATPAASAACTR